MSLQGMQRPIPLETRLLETRLKDILEDKVDDKYYLSDKGVKFVLKKLGRWTQILDGRVGQEVKILDEQNKIIRDDYVGALTTDGSSPKHNNRVIEPREAEVVGGVGEKKSNNGTQYYLQDRIYDGDIGISVCSAFNPNYVDKQFRIRKLTPRECWRLMDFTDEQFDRAQKVNSDSQLYKQAGNSIVVNVLYMIFKEMM